VYPLLPHHRSVRRPAPNGSDVEAYVDEDGLPWFRADEGPVTYEAERTCYDDAGATVLRLVRLRAGAILSDVPVLQDDPRVLVMRPEEAEHAFRVAELHAHRALVASLANGAAHAPSNDDTDAEWLGRELAARWLGVSIDVLDARASSPRSSRTNSSPHRSEAAWRHSRRNAGTTPQRACGARAGRLARRIQRRSGARPRPAVTVERAHAVR